MTLNFTFLYNHPITVGFLPTITNPFPANLHPCSTAQRLHSIILHPYSTFQIKALLYGIRVRPYRIRVLSHGIRAVPYGTKVLPYFLKVAPCETKVIPYGIRVIPYGMKVTTCKTKVIPHFLKVAPYFLKVLSDFYYFCSYVTL